MSSRRIVTDDRVARFVGSRVGVTIFPPWTAMGIERDGEVIAGVVFNCFTGHDIHATVAGYGWTRGFLADVGNYVFDQIKCARITAITEQPQVENLAVQLGGRREGVLRDYFGPDRDAIVIGILKSEYRF